MLIFLLFADDMVLVAESRESLQVNLTEWMRH